MTGPVGVQSRAAQALPDVIVLDALMPGIDGFEVARRLKAQPETPHIPIIFMTGLTETEHVVAAFAAGGVDCVGKEQAVMDSLRKNGNAGLWMPFLNDCATAADTALLIHGLTNPGAPGGRLGVLPGGPLPPSLPSMP